MKRQTNREFIEVGQNLYFKKLHKSYRDKFNTFAEYAASVGISESKAAKLIKIYRVFFKRLGFPIYDITRIGSWSDIYEVSRFCTTRDKARYWLKKVRELDRADLRKLIKKYAKK